MGRRLAAQLIDGLLLSVVFAILFVLMGLALWSGDDSVGSGSASGATSAGETVVVLLAYAIAFLIPLVYQVTMIATRGATVGKMVLGVRVVKIEDGQVPGWVPALLRWLIPFAGSLFCGIGQIVVYLSPFFDSSGRRQGWHDMAAKTVVIRV
ncbi:RDD family protein [Kineosporia mesophila]|nr:RDD family protein [Kineosporia mesophila]